MIPGRPREDPLEKRMATHPVSLPGKFHGLKNLVGCVVHGVAKSQTFQSDFHSLTIAKSFAVHLKLTQHCRSMILQHKINCF